MPRENEWTAAGFTLGMPMGADSCCVLVEKTDLEIAGLAQFIFSEFCRLHCGERRLPGKHG